MLYCNEEIQKLYIEYMNSIKELVREKREVLTSPVYLAGRRQYMRKKRTLRSRLTDKITGKRNKATSYPDLPCSVNDRSDTNYFSNDRIAVYT